MTATEIRIGNYFMGYDGKPFQWTYEHFCLLKRDADVDEIIKEPIALTGEVLEACGFEYKSNTNIDGDEIEWLEHPLMADVTYRNGQFHYILGSRQIPHLKCLHHIQNIIHSLTGQELEVNLTPAPVKYDYVFIKEWRSEFFDNADPIPVGSFLKKESDHYFAYLKDGTQCPGRFHALKPVENYIKPLN